MSGKFLLDTNILIGLFANDQDVVKQLRSNIKVFIPSIVLGELYYGAFGSTQVKENILKIHQLATQHRMKLVSRDNHFGKIEKIQLIKW